MSEYRRGRHEEAIRVASTCLAHPRTFASCRVLVHPIVAMAHHRAGRAEEARAALQAAMKDQSSGWFNDTRDDLGGSWHDWLVGHILIREARALIEGTTDAGPAQR